MSKRKKSLKKYLAGGIAAATLGIGFWASQAFYTVREVIDGDTFVTSEGQYVRFSKIDAPEMENCLGPESKSNLEKLILNKKVFLKVNYIETDRNRLIADVYSANGNVQEKMLESGFAILKGAGGQKALNKAVDTARKSKIGVYSSICTHSNNPKNSRCNIKGNIRLGKKYYRYPGCKQYNTTLVQLHLGEKWFCTELEAEKSGFVKGDDCI